MKDKSIWLDNVLEEKYPTLKQNIECDILIIGGGITGFSCAYFLRENKEKIVLVEGNKICRGTTAKSTGKLTYLQEDLLEKIKDLYDDDTHLKYLQSQKDAIKLAKRIIIDNDIKCDFEPVNSYIFTNNYNKVNSLYNNYRILKKNSNVKWKNDIPIKTKCRKAIEANDTFVFHPVKFVNSLAKIVDDEIDIYENTRITDIDREKDYFIAHTKENEIHAQKIILACHYPLFLIPYLFPLKTSIEKSFIVASEVPKTKAFSAININREVTSLRYYKNKSNYLLLVSENGSLLKNIDNIEKRNAAIWKMGSHFSPKIKYCWSNHDILTSDHLPLIGEIEKGIYIATGYNTWGMTNGILAGQILSDLILEKKNLYQDIFNPLRDEKNIPNIMKFNVKNSYSFLNTKIQKNRNFYRRDVRVITENGIRYGIYVDDEKNLHKVLNQCPHMKCNLSFNYQTKTWDCPCHGSSFDIDGNIIYGPSKDDIKVRDSKH